MASVSLEPKCQSRAKLEFRNINAMMLTLHEGLLLLVKLVHDDVVACHVEEGVVLLHKEEAIFNTGVNAEEVTGCNRNSLHSKRTVFYHISIL